MTGDEEATRAPADPAHRVTLEQFLDGPAHDPADGLRELHGFGGLQGGLLAAMLLREARSHVSRETTPVEISAHYLRGVTTRPELRAEVVHSGRAVSAVSATAIVQGRTTTTATVVLTSSRAPLRPTVLPPPPADVTPLKSAPAFVIPPDFVPVSTRMELRTAGDALPYSGAAEPRLCAWLRLRDPVEDPYERLLVLADAFAPSYAALLDRPQPVPTIRMTLRFTPHSARAGDDWVLLEARTDDAGEDAWVTETVTLWDRDGVALATSTQLRTVLT